jgi:hypothetical protein
MAECTNCSYCSSQASPPHCPLCLPRYQALMHSPIGRISPAMVVGRPDMAPPLCHSRQFGLAPLFPTFCTEVSLVRQSRTVGVCQCALATHANYLCCAIGLSRIQATCVIGLGGAGGTVGLPRMQTTCWLATHASYLCYGPAGEPQLARCYLCCGPGEALGRHAC